MASRLNKKRNKANKPLVSVLLCTRNDGKYIKECIKSILSQTYDNFELIIWNDGSLDDTHNIINSFRDNRIRYYHLKKSSGSISNIRHISFTRIKGKYEINGKYIFTIDGDCVADNYWLREGVKAFKKYKTQAIEGRIIYNTKGYKPSLSDRLVENNQGKEWMTANMGYKREIIEKFPINWKYTRLSDREVALRILKISPIPFISTCIVYHAKSTRTIQSYLKEAERMRFRVMLVKEQNDKINNPFRILNLTFLLVMLFPPLILMQIFRGKIRSWDDLKLLPFVWVKAVYMRFIIWKTAIKEKVFVI